MLFVNCFNDNDLYFVIEVEFINECSPVTLSRINLSKCCDLNIDNKNKITESFDNIAQTLSGTRNTATFSADILLQIDEKNNVIPNKALVCSWAPQNDDVSILPKML